MLNKKHQFERKTPPLPPKFAAIAASNFAVANHHKGSPFLQKKKREAERGDCSEERLKNIGINETSFFFKLFAILGMTNSHRADVKNFRGCKLWWVF